MAHKKGGGSTRNGRDSNAQRRGVKVYGGQQIRAGGIIVRQVGMTVAPGLNVGLGKDYTLYAQCDGTVQYGWASREKKKVSVIQQAQSTNTTA